MRRLEVSAEAELEIFEAALRYEHERRGLGFRFEAQVPAVFARLLENPFQFPAVEEDIRGASWFATFPTGCSSRRKRTSSRCSQSCTSIVIWTPGNDAVKLATDGFPTEECG